MSEQKMKIVVITGSTSGIGQGLADAFLARGCAVVISGHNQANLDRAYGELSGKYGKDRILAHLCDVTNYSQVAGLWNAAKARFGRVDIWINNAGAGHGQTPMWEYTRELIDKVVAANVTGALYGLNVALKGMMQQQSGSVYNMEGLGSSGPMIKGLALYSSTKAAVAYLTHAAAKEVEGTPVIVGGLSPGMVVTKLITDQYKDKPEERQRVARIFNILCDRVETVTPWLADQVLANKKNGVTIQWLSRQKAMMRFMGSPFRKRHVFD